MSGEVRRAHGCDEECARQRHHIRAYYALGVTKQRMHDGKRVGPRIAVGGEFAIQTWGATADAADLDFQILTERADIGRIDIRAERGGYQTVWTTGHMPEETR